MSVTPVKEQEHEGARLAALRRYEVLDTPPESAFDRLTRIAARLFIVPIAAVALVDEKRVWFKASQGIGLDAVERKPGLSGLGILQDEPLIIVDARSDDRTASHSLVAGEPGIRFYAGAPLKTPDGFNIGMVYIADQRPREFDASDSEALADIASLIMDELELRRRRGGGAAVPTAASGITWEEPPSPKSRTIDDWSSLLAAVTTRPNVWAKITHYSGETSAYRAANQLRSRDGLPPGDWEFAARRAGTGSDLFARVAPGG